MNTTEYTVTGMTCSHCERSVTQEVSALPGVESVEVSAATGLLKVSASVELDDVEVLAAVDEAGYAAVRS